MSKLGLSKLLSSALIVFLIIGMVPVSSFAMRFSSLPEKLEIPIGAVAGNAGNIDIREVEMGEWGTNDRDITVTLPDGITWSTTPTATKNGPGDLVIKDVFISDPGQLVVRVAGDDNANDKFTLSNIKYKVGLGTPTGNITVTIASVEPTPISGFTVSNATIIDSLVVSSDSRPDVTVGRDNQIAGDITITESRAELLSEDTTITLKLPVGITFSRAPTATDDSDSFSLADTGTADLSQDHSMATFTVSRVSAVSGVAITIIDLQYNIASDTPEGDVVVDVVTSGSVPISSDSIVNARASLPGSADIYASPADVFASSNQTAGTVSIDETKRGFLLPGTITLALDKGNFTEPPIANALNIGLSSAIASLSDDRKTATWVVIEPSTQTTSSPGLISINGIFLDIPKEATGTITATIGGTAGAFKSNLTIANIVIDDTGQLDDAEANQINDPNYTIASDSTEDDSKGDDRESTESFDQNDALVLVQAKTVFSDVPADAWYESYVSELLAQKIVNGYSNGKFMPNNNVARAEFIKMVCLAMGWDLDNPASSSFKDIPRENWAYKYIETAKSYGAISGYKNGSFQPKRNISRAEVAKIVSTVLNLEPGLSSLSDSRSHWADEYIGSCISAEIMNGFPDGTFRPNSPATRAEAAKIIARLLDNK